MSPDERASESLPVPAPRSEADPFPAAEPLRREWHGEVSFDPHHWLADTESAPARAFVARENARAADRLAPLAPLAEQIVTEIAARTEETDRSVPVRVGDRWRYRRTVLGLEYPIHVDCPVVAPDDWEPPVIDREAPAPGERVLFDENVAAAGHEFFELGSFDVSPDGALVLVAVDTVGDERYELTVREADSGRVVAGPIPGTFAGAVFTPAGDGVLYPTVDEAWRPDTIWWHGIGAGRAEVPLVHEPDERFWLDVDRDLDGDTIVLTSASSITTEVTLLDRRVFAQLTAGADPAAALPEPDWPRQSGVDAALTPLPAAPGREAGVLVIDNAEHRNFSLRVRDASGQERTLIPGSEEVRLETALVCDRFVALEYRRDGLPRVAVVPNAALLPGLDPAAHELGDQEALRATTLAGAGDRAQPGIRLAVSSLAHPTAVFDVDPARPDAPWVLRKRRPAPGVRPEDYLEWREWAVATDGVRVPLSLIARRDALGPEFGGTGAPGPRPVHLYGYGAYEISIDPAFSAARLSVLDRGAVFAIAHVRGGGELGRGWYEDGRLAHKPNSFSDFVSAADHLAELGLADPARIVAEGRSAGGLLVGAAANLALERFAGVLAGVPFVDPLTSMLDPELPLTVVEWDEWGNPVADAEIYHLMRGYSPVENVRPAARFPEVLAVTNANDTRVLPAEPAKWVAALREAGANATLLTDDTGGHGGASGRTAAWAERARELAWVLDVLGLADAAPPLASEAATAASPAAASSAGPGLGSLSDPTIRS
ncbi:S9 family peptidase [Leucobacter sp. M11]|uniref:S9 family peptidase n=1 Tax=Leucobacter sp. M11 TaxID=2993565 RepID=UPI002D7F43CE|nr:prolyl oligopeptidase family serine peptidase [Leucobacter sp. M11]MEB4615708.1 prolyl oligopeptidase family serine peptidase [Leucobacter sp. M11]